MIPERKFRKKKPVQKKTTDLPIYVIGFLGLFFAHQSTTSSSVTALLSLKSHLLPTSRTGNSSGSNGSAFLI